MGTSTKDVNRLLGSFETQDSPTSDKSTNTNRIESTKDVNRLLGLDDSFGAKPDSYHRIDSLRGHYENLVRKGEIKHDVHQINALHELDRLRRECITYLKQLDDAEEEENDDDDLINNTTNSSSGAGKEESWLATSIFELSNLTPIWSSNKQSSMSITPPRVYLHGGVGCGKTYCMDLFYNSLPSTTTTGKKKKKYKQKVHFHKFMLNIHKQMHSAKMVNGLQGDYVFEHVIQSTLKAGKILCFDEFQVTDIADGKLVPERLLSQS